MMSVKAFGEAEFWFAMIKVATILIFVGVATWAILTQAHVGEYTAGVHNISESGGWFPEGLAPVFALALPYNAYSSEVSPSFPSSLASACLTRPTSCRSSSSWSSAGTTCAVALVTWRTRPPPRCRARKLWWRATEKGRTVRLHVTYAGGTIGMVDSPEGLRPGADLQGWFGSQLEGIELAQNITMSTLDPLIDSSEATPEDWQAIIDDITAHADEADAFLVLHGTDTMAYSAAALSYALASMGKPVVLTGSQYPLGVVGSDASANVTGALRAAMSRHALGVMLFFGHKLLAGNRATKTSSWAFRGFESPSVSPMARTGAPWRWYGAPQPGTGWQDPSPYARQDVAVIDVVPGMSAARLRAMTTPHPDALILRTFGVGNIPASEPGLVAVLEELAQADVPIIVASQCYQAEVMLGHYEAGNALAKLGAVGAHDMTLEALYAKTVFLLSQGKRGADFARWMDTSIAGELTPQD